MWKRSILSPATFPVLLLLVGCAPEGASGWTRLMRASASGELGSVQAILEEGVDPNATDGSGNSALTLAAQFGRTEIAARLLEGGAVPDLADAEGITPLMKAARFGHEETSAVLLRAGADPSRRDEAGRSAADWAEAAGQASLATRLRQLEVDSAP